MFTNTYLPHVGGVARSISSFEEEFRRRGHEVRIIAPTFNGANASSKFVLCVPAIQNFNGSDFSVRIPQPFLIADYIDDFAPDIIHSHHPFLLGDAALRTAWRKQLPLVFTHHTRYEEYTHYVPLDSEALRRVVIQMTTEYCNRCTQVIAPSESIARLLKQRQVTQPVCTIPTGIAWDHFATGNGVQFREQHQIRPDALVVGHVGRLAEEKNLAYLARSVSQFLAKHPDAHWLVIGTGESSSAIKHTVEKLARPEQLKLCGALQGQSLVDAYAAMDVFVFSSQSETQGLVLAEAMAACTPVVALDGPGVRDVVRGDNGRLLPADANEEAFADAIEKITCDRDALKHQSDRARQSVSDLKIECCADRMLRLYEQLIDDYGNRDSVESSPWDALLKRLDIEWNLLVEKSKALAAGLEIEVTKRP